jgi:squalene-hopene/tetraprenyl-beta-curcumene cyclase
MSTTADRRPESFAASSGLADARAALKASVALLRSQQEAGGWWKGALDTNVTMDAEDLMMRAFLNMTAPEVTEPTARWIRSQQRADGTWAVFPGGPGDLSTTAEAWVALRLAGDSPDETHMRNAAAFVRGEGGVEASRVFTRIWFSLCGLWSWDDCPELPPEIMFFPRWMPLNIYDWGCWARGTIVPLTIVCTLKPVRPLSFGIDELRSGRRRRFDRPWTIAGVFQRLDKLLHWYARHPFRPLRRLAMRQALEWILARQEADGAWGGIQPPSVYSLLALQLMGYPMDHPAIVAGFAGLEGFFLHGEAPDGPTRRLEGCQSPVWDTALSLAAMLEAGVAPDDPAVLDATDWLLDKQIVRPGDWAVRRPHLPSGAWAFEFANDNYPDTDDTAEVILCLSGVAHPDQARVDAALGKAVEWTAGMQSRDGGWGAFDADNNSALVAKLPFCDFGAVTDPASADVTAHVVEMLSAVGAHDERCQRGVQWLLDNQEPDGSWYGRWGVNYIYGTGAAVPALVAAGIAVEAAPIRSAVAWLKRQQNDDGGWGEDPRSYDDRSWAGRGPSTASQTAWALLALLAAGEHDGTEVARGVGWLAAAQRSDGGWDEEEFTGTGFPSDMYIKYEMYPLVFPMWALGRYLRART